MLPEERLYSHQVLHDEVFLQDTKVKHRIIEEIEKYNQQGKSLGRRTLAVILDLPESTIRRIIGSMEEEGCIRVRKGRQGLRLCEH